MKKVLFLFLLLAGMTNVYGQKFAVKSNLLYDATATINLGVGNARARCIARPSG